MTDDVVFVHADESQARDRLRIFDQTLADHNVPRKVEKDVSVATEVVALGCHLGNSPPWVEPDLDKVVWTQQCALGIARRGRVTPRACSTVLGTMQWFCLVNRWLFSCFEEVYQFVDAANLDQDTVVPDGAVGELLLFSALAHFGVADLERLFLDIVVATDASPAFGFGLSVRACSRESTLDLAALSQQSSGFVLFNDVADLAADLQVHGVPVVLPFAMDSFTDVLSFRAREQAHAGALECHGVLLAIQWILRSTARFGRRVILAIDAQAILHVVLKGRTSAGTLGRTTCSIAAHCMAGDLLVYPLWVPSKANPADAPSRGKRRRPVARRLDKVHKAVAKNSAVAAAARLEAAARRLYAAGALL